MSVYSELMNENDLPTGRRQRGTARRFGSRGPRVVWTAADVAREERARAAQPAKPAKPAKPETDVSHTEHEGPSLREKLAYLSEIAVRAESPDEKTARQKKEAATTAAETLRRKQGERQAGYKAHPETLKLRAPGSGGRTVSHTEYEGPSLREKLKCLSEKTVEQQHAEYEKLRGEIITSREAGKQHQLDPGKEIKLSRKSKLKSHTEHEGPSLSEADFASSLERLKKKNPALARHRVRTTPYPSGLSKGKEGHQQETPYTGKEKAEVQAAIKYYRKNPVLRGAAAEEARAKRKFPVKSSTEYEGPSLSEEEKDITKDPKHQARVIAKLLADRETLRKAGQRDKSPITTPRGDAKQARADDKAQKSWTEYEGPSLKEQLEYLIDRTGKTAPSKLSRTKKSNIMAKWLSKRGASKAERDPASVTGSTQQQKTTTKAGEPVKATHTAKTGEGGEGGTSPFVSRTRIQIRPGEGHDAGVDIIRKPHARDIDKKKKPKKKKPKSQKEQLEYLASFFLNEQPRVDPKMAAMRTRGVNTSVTSQVRSAETLAQGRGAMNPTQRRDMRIKFSGAQAKRTQRSWDRPGVTAAKPGQRVPSTTQGHFGNPSK